MKLSLKPANSAASPTQSPAPQTPSIKLSFKRTEDAANASSTSAKASTPQSAGLNGNGTVASKKRPREDDGSGAAASGKKRAKVGQILKLHTGMAPASGKGTAKTPIATPATARLKLNQKGKIAQRPKGVGYDSDAEDAEADPAIEENFVLRMPDGPDAEYVRQAIENRTMGDPVTKGGADFSMRFFTKDARRSMVAVQGRYYAACMVDLPCIIESMKSWDKKGWYKSADISQMLYVFKQVSSEEEAKTCDLPREVDQRTWQWPDGLTPPMKNVRKRRFRKRANYKQIEKVEEEIERQLALDEECKRQGGTVEFNIIDRDAEEEEESSEEEVQDVEEIYEEDDEAGEEEESDEAAAARLAAAFGEDDGIPDSGIPTEVASPAVPAEAELTSGDAAPTPVNELTNPAETEVQSAEDDDDDDDEEDEADEQEPVEEDDEAREKAAFEAQQREEIAHIEREIEAAKRQHAQRQTAILKARDAAKIKSLENDLQVKKRAIGLGYDDDDA